MVENSKKMVTKLTTEIKSFTCFCANITLWDRLVK